MFEDIERDALPPRAFELTYWLIGTVQVDAHLEVGKAPILGRLYG